MTMTEAEHKIAELFKNEEKAPKGKKKKGGKKAKDNGEKMRAAKPVAEGIVAAVAAKVGADHEIGKRVKELRDTGMAWWQIAYQLELPGSGPNVASGKAGAARARAAYKKTFGELPGDVARRSTKATRAAGEATGAPVVRKQLFSPALLVTTFETEAAEAEANAEILERVTGKLIRWIGRTQMESGPPLETEREARVHPNSPRIERLEGDRTILHFREQDKPGDRPEQWRSICLADVYDIRR